MKDHFNLTQKSYDDLLAQNVTAKDFFETAKLFDPTGARNPVSKISLYYYIDKKGDFNSPPHFPHRKIARAFFETLSPHDKLKVLEYIDEQTSNTNAERERVQKKNRTN